MALWLCSWFHLVKLCQALQSRLGYRIWTYKNGLSRLSRWRLFLKMWDWAVIKRNVYP